MNAIYDVTLSISWMKEFKKNLNNKFVELREQVLASETTDAQPRTELSEGTIHHIASNVCGSLIADQGQQTKVYKVKWFYTKIVPMLQISALYHVAYAMGYQADIRGIRHNSYIRGFWGLRISAHIRGI